MIFLKGWDIAVEVVEKMVESMDQVIDKVMCVGGTGGMWAEQVFPYVQQQELQYRRGCKQKQRRRQSRREDMTKVTVVEGRLGIKSRTQRCGWKVGLD